MVTELGLKGNELLIYALIYGFSQTRDQWFTGTLRYIAEWTNSTVRGVQKALGALIEKGLLEKAESEEKGVKSCRYRAWNKVPDGYGTKFVGGMNKVPGGIEQSSPNNIDNNNNIYNTPYTHYSTTLRNECSPQGEKPPTTPVEGEKKSGKGKGKKKTEFIPPTLGEVIAYCASRGNLVDPHKFYDYYDASGWFDGKGNPVRNWKQKCITWERSEGGDSRRELMRSSDDVQASSPAMSEAELDELFGFEMPGKREDEGC